MSPTDPHLAPDRVVVPLPPGRGAAAAGGPAVDVAADLARRWGAEVVLLAVAPVTGAAVPVAGALDELAARCAGAGAGPVRVRRADYGSVAAAVVEAAGPGGVVCMPTHGAERSGALVHAVTDEVLAAVAGPAVLVSPRVPPGGLRPGRVVACVEDPAAAGATVAAGRRLASDLDLPLWLAEIVPPGARPGRGPAEGPSAAGRVVVEGRDPARAVAGLAAREPVTLLVMATHARCGWQRMWSGSVTAATAHRARCPVVAVRAAPEAGRARAR